MPRGRKTKLDADMIERICELIRLQMFVESDRQYRWR